jgi:WhiB family redox-sensing transcriptional regulator
MNMWKHRNCANIDNPDVFFPHSINSARPAKLICSECPVSTLCLEYALENGEKHGIWGGLTATERQLLKPGYHKRPKIFVPPDEHGHGYKGYRKGCKCAVCKAAWAEYTRKQKALKAASRKHQPCQICGRGIQGQGRHTYCSTKCRQAADAARNRNNRLATSLEKAMA